MSREKVTKNLFSIYLVKPSKYYPVFNELEEMALNKKNNTQHFSTVVLLMFEMIALFDSVKWFAAKLKVEVGWCYSRASYFS